MEQTTKEPVQQTMPAQQTGEPADSGRPVWPYIAAAAPLAVYLIARGITEFFVIHYGQPATYANDWGGPSLAGVFAVHSGPAVVIIAAMVWWAVRHRRHGRQILFW
jgi:hypothetical protein